MVETMESPVGQQSSNGKKMAKQLTGKRDDTPLHSAARSGDLTAVQKIVSETKDEELKDMLCKQNQAGETALYVACESGNVEVVKEMVKYHTLETAGVKAKNGYDALHIAAKQGDLGIASEPLKKKCLLFGFCHVIVLPSILCLVSDSFIFNDHLKCYSVIDSIYCFTCVPVRCRSMEW